jgi:DNA polymerase-3 subunit delta'
MAGFEDIVGQKRIINHLKNAIKLDRPSHAYIFHGDDGIGKRLTAEIFAKGLLCEQIEGAPCGKCRSCIQMDTGNNPDFIKVTHEKSVISVDDIRSQLISEMQIKPYTAKYKIFMVDEAEKMNEQAQNALLKTLEEPPEYGIIILLTNNLNMFLDTILSRAVALAFMPAGRSEIKEFLMKKRAIPDYQARTAAACAGGCPGKALNWVDSEEFSERREKSMEVLKKIGKMEPAFAIKRSKEWAKQKDDIDFFRRLLEAWIRDVLYVKATGRTVRCMFVDESTLLKEQAGKLSFEKLGHILEMNELLGERLSSNVNTEVSLERLFMELG